jgi:hypothetical protein
MSNRHEGDRCGQEGDLKREVARKKHVTVVHI